MMSKYCAPCQKIAPKIAELAQTYSSIKFYKVDVDESEDIAELENVAAMPTFLFYKNGQLIDTIVGANLPAVKNSINRYM